jgi:hypothetical protein
MIVDRRRREALLLECPLPGEDIPLEEGADPVVTVTLHEELDEAVKVEGIFAATAGERNGGSRRGPPPFVK